MKFKRLFIPTVTAGLLIFALLFLMLPSAASAQGSSECSQAANCVEVFETSGTYTVTTHILTFTIKAGGTSIDVVPPDTFNNGCYLVEFTASEPNGDIDVVTWRELFTEDENPNNCQNISVVEIWWYVGPTAITLSSASASSGGFSLPPVDVMLTGAFLLTLIAMGVLSLWHYGRRWRRR